MKSSLWPLCFALTLLPSLAWAAGMNVDRRIEQLDQLVHLTAGQRSKAAEVFKSESDALQSFSTEFEQVVKGATIREQARAKIRASLTPSQREIYDHAPQRLGGGALQDSAARVSRLDQVVAFTDEQREQVTMIYRRETEALFALPAAERSEKGAPIRQAAKAQVRALLTPEQQRKWDANPRLATDLAEQAFVVNFIKNSTGIAARLGAIVRVDLKSSTSSSDSFDQQVQSMKCCYIYDVQGSTSRELLKIYWERGSPSDLIKVIKIEDSTGAAIQP